MSYLARGIKRYIDYTLFVPTQKQDKITELYVT